VDRASLVPDESTVSQQLGQHLDPVPRTALNWVGVNGETGEPGATGRETRPLFVVELIACNPPGQVLFELTEEMLSLHLTFLVLRTTPIHVGVNPGLPRVTRFGHPGVSHSNRSFCPGPIIFLAGARAGIPVN
jgi:hypothetical protein